MMKNIGKLINSKNLLEKRPTLSEVVQEALRWEQKNHINLG